ncbi:hypothetical protein OBBRIDRAFT_807929 [Obba rivulosa]|uniref:Uncharacterized protein n=1 Tax=Obba rivulosa TaxID=1052685 RepID=A0A8E2DEI1_9APHY|nr:hypothetical protein OBBRIDRAFT_807929 [Obba rivulosa]
MSPVEALVFGQVRQHGMKSTALVSDKTSDSNNLESHSDIRELMLYECHGPPSLVRALSRFLGAVMKYGSTCISERAFASESAMAALLDIGSLIQIRERVAFFHEGCPHRATVIKVEIIDNQAFVTLRPDDQSLQIVTVSATHILRYLVFAQETELPETELPETELPV